MEMSLKIDTVSFESALVMKACTLGQMMYFTDARECQTFLLM